MDIHSFIVTSDRKLWAADQGTHKILGYDLQGHFLYSWGSWGEYPGGMWGVHGMSVDQEGNFYVAEAWSVFGEVGGQIRTDFDTVWPDLLFQAGGGGFMIVPALTGLAGLLTVAFAPVRHMASGVLAAEATNSPPTATTITPADSSLRRKVTFLIRPPQPIGYLQNQ